MPVLPSTAYRVGRSKTGLGLFATEPIKKGAKIVRYFGPLLDSKNKDHDAIENKYLFQIDKRWTIDGSVRENVARYINHGCKPNAESDVSKRKKKVIIRAIKRIEPGEEISYDYGTEYFKAYLKPLGCKCDACEKKRARKAEAVKAAKKADRLKTKAKADSKADRKIAKAGKAKSLVKSPAKKVTAAKAAPKKVASGKKTAAKTATAKGVRGAKSVTATKFVASSKSATGKPRGKPSRQVAKAA